MWFTLYFCFLLKIYRSGQLYYWLSVCVYVFEKFQNKLWKTQNQTRPTGRGVGPHQQVVSAASSEDFRDSPLPSSDECHKLEDDSIVLLHLVDQAQVDQHLRREMPQQHVECLGSGMWATRLQHQQKHQLAPAPWLAQLQPAE